MAGGRDFFDALIERVRERSESGYQATELLASLLEVSFAQFRALLALSGAKDIPKQLEVLRPGRKQAKMSMTPQELARHLGKLGATDA